MHYTTNQHYYNDRLELEGQKYYILYIILLYIKYPSVVINKCVGQFGPKLNFQSMSNLYLFLPFSKTVQSIFESEIEGMWFVLNKQLIISILRKSNLGVF